MGFLRLLVYFAKLFSMSFVPMLIAISYGMITVLSH